MQKSIMHCISYFRNTKETQSVSFSSCSMWRRYISAIRNIFPMPAFHNCCRTRSFNAFFCTMSIPTNSGMNMSENKIFNDPIHGTIKLEPFLVKIIDTPEFQRLRHIKQLGGTYYVYPEAQHNRFEHSIGTAHLAGKLVEHLRQRQPELLITDQDVLCVKVAGLCHDLGHGPFSHLFDGMFLPRQGVSAWEHEKGSCDIFDRLIERVDPNQVSLFDKDRKFIKEMINGNEMTENWTHKGRNENKSFLYEIISNKTNGVDVDKWDYFARDCYHLGIPNGFDHNRFIECMKVLEVEVQNQRRRRRICYRDKEVYNLYDMFHTRFSLHKRACQHKAGNAIELMICEALSKADPHVMISNGEGRECRMSRCVKRRNIGSYCNLDDRILQKIEHSEGDNLEPARKILKRLSDGDRYRCIGNKVYRERVDKCKKSLIEETIGDDIESRLLPSFENSIKAHIVTFNYGKGKKDPIECSRFYSKRNPKTARQIPKEEVSALLPSVFEEHWIQVFCTKERLSKEDIESAEEAFDEWYNEVQTDERPEEI